MLWSRGRGYQPVGIFSLLATGSARLLGLLQTALEAAREACVHV